jgi:hypothetical protein
MSGFAALAAETSFAAEPVSTLFAWVTLGAVGGLLGAVAMDAAMHRQPDGWTPAFVAAAVLRRTRPDRVEFRDALVVHHLAGVLAGVLYALVGWVVVVAAGSTGVVAVALGHLTGVVVVVGFVYAFFAHVVLPRRARGVYEERATAVRGQWLRSSLVFGAVLLVGGLSFVAAVG